MPERDVSPPEWLRTLQIFFLGLQGGVLLTWVGATYHLLPTDSLSALVAIPIMYIPMVLPAICEIIVRVQRHRRLERGAE